LYVDYDLNKAVADIKALMEGQEADILHKCITCCACREYCPTGADPFDLIIKAQEKFKAFPVLAKGADRMELALEIPSEVIAGDPGKPVLSLCVMERTLPEGVLEGQLFKGLTVVKGGDYFCLIGFVHVGQESPIERGARKFIDNLANLGKPVVFLHDDCYAMVHAKVKDYGLAVPFRYQHLFEYLRDYLRDHRSSITKLNKKVAYQRPCASRYTPEKDAVLDEIFELIGVERPPRKYERETALCCTGPIIRVFPDLAQETQAKNIDDALACGAEALITLCPVCDRILRRPAAARGLAKIFITDLCRMALGEKAFPD
jgi:Fe-S oxidoreductase